MAHAHIAHAGYDPVTDTLQDWALDAMQAIAQTPGFSWTDPLTPGRIDRIELEESLVGGVALLAFYGHGNKLAMWGAPSARAIDGDNAEDLSGATIVYAVACCTARPAGVACCRVADGGIPCCPESSAGLAERAVAAETHAYIGYADQLLFWDDHRAVHFRTPANAGVRALVASPGATAGDAYEAIRYAYEAAIDYFVVGVGAQDPVSGPIPLALQADLDCLMLVGDPTTSL